MRFHTSLQRCAGRLRSGQICNKPQAYNILILGERHILCSPCIKAHVEDWERIEHELMMVEQRLASITAAAEEDDI
jgi:hypothetical protein